MAPLVATHHQSPILRSPDTTYPVFAFITRKKKTMEYKVKALASGDAKEIKESQPPRRRQPWSMIHRESSATLPVQQQKQPPASVLAS